MTKNTETESGRRPATAQAVHDGDHHHDDHRHRHEAGIDLPVVGHVPYRSVAFLAGLGVAGAAGVIEWPVATAVGIGYVFARR